MSVSNVSSQELVECPVCLDIIAEGDQVLEHRVNNAAQEVISHCFHKACLIESFTAARRVGSSPSCPLCRAAARHFGAEFLNPEELKQELKTAVKAEDIAALHRMISSTAVSQEILGSALLSSITFGSVNSALVLIDSGRCAQQGLDTALVQAVSFNQRPIVSRLLHLDSISQGAREQALQLAVFSRNVELTSLILASGEISLATKAQLFKCAAGHPPLRQALLAM